MKTLLPLLQLLGILLLIISGIIAIGLIYMGVTYALVNYWYITLPILFLGVGLIIAARQK
jgi:hypothetical protein